MSYQDVALKKYLSQVLETLKTVTQLVEMEISREPEKPPTPKPIEERVVPRPQKIITSPHKCADESDEDFRMGLLKRMPDPKDYTPAHLAARLLGIDHRTLSNWEKQGLIKSFRVPYSPTHSYRFYKIEEIHHILINGNGAGYKGYAK